MKLQMLNISKLKRKASNKSQTSAAKLGNIEKATANKKLAENTVAVN